MRDKRHKEEYLRDLLGRFAAHRGRPLILLSMDRVRHKAVTALSDALRGRHFEDLDVVLRTPGGKIEAAYQIIKMLRAHARRITVIVPSYAKSAGTLICLSADTIMLGITSELGPLDVQLPEKDGRKETYKSALNGYKALKQVQHHAIENLDAAITLILRRTDDKMPMSEVIRLAIEFSSSTTGPLYQQIKPKTISEYARALEIGVSYGMKILEHQRGWEHNRAAKAIGKLVYHYPSHGFIIDGSELSALGFDVEEPGEQGEILMQDLDRTLESVKNPDGMRIDLHEPPSSLPMKIHRTRKIETPPGGR